MSPKHSLEGKTSVEEKSKQQTPQEKQKTTKSEEVLAAPSSTNMPSSSKSASDSDSEFEEDQEEEKPSSPKDVSPAAAPQWQAIWSPEYNAYYFFNATTQETTWTNPLQLEASSSSTITKVQTVEEAATAAIAAAEASAEASASTGPQLSAVAAHHAALQAAALAQGIDPLLAHLDPTLLQSAVPGSSSAPGDLPTFQAKFNARTGQFAPMSSRTPGHLSEFERAKRMSEFYFDVNKWEEDLAKRGGRLMGEEGEEEEGAGKKRKRPSKKDLERFKEQKKAKKIAKTAWLRT